MGLLADVVNKLLSISGYQPPSYPGPALTDQSVEEIRKSLGSNIQPIPTTKIRWYLRDLESAQAQADGGHIQMAARLWRTMKRDGVLTGLLGTRTDGLVRLPKRFYGDDEVCADLRAFNGTRSTFDEMCPPSELGMMIGDGIGLGISVCELVPVPGRNYPVMVRLDPEFLDYYWPANQWFFNSIAGRIPIVPGDGRWVLHIPGGRIAPWMSGLWPALGRSFINKEHAMLHRSNYSRKLANPAVAAVSPDGAAEQQRRGFFKRLLDWGTNNVFEVPIGWDVKLIESNGRAWDVFQREIDTSDNEYMVALAGQIVTTTGGTGFANADIHQAIRKDLVQATGESLAYTINTQVLPQFIWRLWGDDGLATREASVEWDTSTPADREKESRTLGQLADAISKLDAALAPHDRQVEIDEMCVRYNVPVAQGAAPGALVAAPTPEGQAAAELVTGDANGETR